MASYEEWDTYLRYVLPSIYVVQIVVNVVATYAWPSYFWYLLAGNLLLGLALLVPVALRFDVTAIFVSRRELLEENEVDWDENPDARASDGLSTQGKTAKELVAAYDLQDGNSPPRGPS